MLVIFNISVVLNFITFDLVTPDTVFMVLFYRDVTPNRLVYFAIVSLKKPWCFHLQRRKKFLEDVGSMFLPEAFVPKYQALSVTFFMTALLTPKVQVTL
jgi:hypothetical protein